MFVLQWKVLDDKIRIVNQTEHGGVSLIDASRGILSCDDSLSSGMKVLDAVVSRGGVGGERRFVGTTPTSLVARRGIGGIRQIGNSGHGSTTHRVTDTNDDDDDAKNDDDEGRVVVEVEQLKGQVDFLLEKKARLERDTACLREEMDILVEQKGVARLELSELTYDMESARRALESLQVDMVREQDAFLVGHKKMLSTMDDDLEQRKSLAMNTLALEKKHAEEKEREVEKKAVEVEARMHEVKRLEEEVAQAREVLREESRKFQERCDAFQNSIASREAVVAEREKECQEMQRDSYSVLSKEKNIAMKEQELIRDEANIQKRYIELEEKEKAFKEEERAMSKEKVSLVKEREELVLAKRLHEDHVCRDRKDIEREQISLDERMRECSAREEALRDMGDEEQRMESQRTDLVAEIQVCTRDLEEIRSRIEEEQEVLSRIQEEKNGLIQQRESLVKREEELDELSARLEEEDKVLEAAKVDMENVSKTVKDLIQDVKSREEALDKATSLIDPKLEEISAKEAQLDADFAALHEMMEEMEKEGHELEDRFECLLKREDEFDRHKKSWEKECSIKESLLQDVQETLDYREKELDLRESGLVERIEMHEIDIDNARKKLDDERHAFERSMAEREAQYAKDAKAIAQERSQIAKEWQAIAEERHTMAEVSKQVSEREASLQSEKERIEQLYSESTSALNNAERMKNEVRMDRDMLESREKRVLQLEKEAETLQAMVSEKNLNISSALEKASQKESAAALKIQEADMMMQQAIRIKEDAEKQVLQWEKEVHESREKELKAAQSVERVQQDTLILQKSMESLKALENHLQEREWKLHESWKAIKVEASRSAEPILNEPGNALYNILELDSLHKDAKRAEEDTENVSILSNQKFNASNPEIFSKLYTSWAHAAKKETLLQRWTVSLVLEAKRQQACEDRLTQSQREFSTQLADAQQHRSTAEKLMKEIEMKEIELENSMREYEVSQKKLCSEKARLEHDSLELQKQQDELEAAKRELYCRESSIKSLEISWKDRMSEVRDREKSVSDLQRRLAHQREALEDRESRLLESEEKLRDDTMALSSKRSALDAIETRLSKKEADLKEREADADALLSASRKEMELASQVSSKSQARLIEIEERALELEAVSEQIDEKMRHLQNLEDIAHELESREEALKHGTMDQQDCTHTSGLIDLISS